MKEYTKILGRYAAELKYEALPASAIEQAKKIMLHTVAVSVASRNMSPTANAAAMAAARGTEGTASVWATGARVAPTEAVYANGTAADVLDWEDCTWTGHASAGAVPAAFAYGEQKHASGKEVITAVVAAYEVYQRIAMAVQPEFDSYLAQGRGWGLVNWQVFASAVAAGKLLGLDALQMAACISLAAYQAPTLMGKDGDGDIYHYAHGIAGRSGAESAEITRQGFEYYYDGLEGDTGYWLYVSNRCEWDWLDKELGKTFYINETLLKHWPANVWVQAPLDGLHNICTREKLGLSDIEKVRVSPIIDITSVESPLPMGLIQAEYSLPHCFACYLSGKKPSEDWYSLQSRSSEELYERSKIVEYFGPQANRLHMFEVFWQGTFPETTVEVVCKDGRVFRETLRCPKGHPRNNFTLQEEQQFFIERTASLIGRENAEKFAQGIAGLEACEDLNALTALLAAE